MPNLNSYEERELLSRIALGEESAFADLFGRYRNRVYSIALKLTHSPLTSEEIVQDVFFKIWRKRNDLTGVQHFSAYLFAITRNNVYRVLKQIAGTWKLTRLTDESSIATGSDAADRLMEKEYNTLLQKAVDRLPKQQKQVYKLIKNKGLKRDEVATLLHLCPETVKFHLAQAMKDIRSFCMLHLDLYIGVSACLSLLIGE